jgi:hypothetical protein
MRKMMLVMGVLIMALCQFTFSPRRGGKFLQKFRKIGVKSLSVLL